MKLTKLAGATSEIWQIFIADSSSTTGAGLTGLTNASGSLTAYYHRDTDTTATAISLVTMTVGTFTSSGFKEIDATNMPGCYQFCPPNAALAAGAKSCLIMLKGASNMAQLPIEVQLAAYNPDDAIHLGLTCLPNTAVTTNASLLTSGTGTDQVSVSGGKILLQATQSGVTIPTVTTVTNQLTAAQVATGVWQDTTAGDFTTASSIGKSLYTSGTVPGASGGLFIAGTNAATTITTALTTTFTGNLTGSVASVTAGVTLAASAVQAIWDALTSALTTANSIGKLLVDNINATISSRMATYTQPTGFLAATFPTGTIANTTNITAGTMTTTTNLTNAPTAGDFTATMKTSLNAATPAVTVSDKTGFSLTSAYDASKTASQAGDAMTLTGAYDFAKGTVAMTESYPTLGATMTPAQALYQAVQHLGESGIIGTTKTIKKRDGATTAKTFTLDSATTPTSITEAS